MHKINIIYYKLKKRFDNNIKRFDSDCFNNKMLFKAAN